MLKGWTALVLLHSWLPCLIMLEPFIHKDQYTLQKIKVRYRFLRKPKTKQWLIQFGSQAKVGVIQYRGLLESGTESLHLQGQIIGAQLKQQEKQIGTWASTDPVERLKWFPAGFKAAQNKARARMIPRPSGQAGRGVEKGGYHLQSEMGLEGDDKRYNRQCRMVNRYVQGFFSVSRPIPEQDRGRVAQMIKLVQKDIPYFQKFEDGWPIRDITRTYLSNEQPAGGMISRRKLVPANPKQKSKRKAAVKFVPEEADGEDDELELSDAPANSKKTPPAIVKPRKKANTQMVLSDSDHEEEDDDLDILVKSLDKKKRKVELEKSTTATKSDSDLDSDAESSKKTKETHLPLTWDDLPPKCPLFSVLILFLLSRRQELKVANGPKAPGTTIPKGLSLLEAEICIAIEQESRRKVVLRLGSDRNWLKDIDFEDLRLRIGDMEADILKLFTDPTALHECPIWTDFLTAIEFKLFALLNQKLSSLRTRLQTNIAGNRKCFGKYEPSSDSLLGIDDFTAFVLVPFAATTLILQDLAGLGNLQDALLERNDSKEYGELIHPEDDEDDKVQQLHRQNIMAVRRLQNQREPEQEEPEQDNAPESLKIRIRPPTTVPDEEIALDELTSPKQKKHVVAVPKKPKKPTPQPRKKVSYDFCKCMPATIWCRLPHTLVHVYNTLEVTAGGSY
ncbi:hypothetical protein DFH09DRAFT_1104472 [Mycena vulgaris]|nr:hypothetical protein DFH09DRAFT_1104472 [Mycena vulgaris]